MLSRSHWPKDNELVRREMQEVWDALEAFKAAVEVGEETGFKPEGDAGRMTGCETGTAQAIILACDAALRSCSASLNTSWLSLWDAVATASSKISH